MAGRNPYIEAPEVTLPTTPYKIIVLPMDRVVEVDPSNLPEHEDGLEGSLLGLLLANGVPVDHACGGVCACSTCHVIVKQGLASCNEPTDDEEDQLEEARGLTISSRLACQTVPDGTMDVVVEIPEWNINLVAEGH